MQYMTSWSTACELSHRHRPNSHRHRWQPSPERAATGRPQRPARVTVPGRAKAAPAAIEGEREVAATAVSTKVQSASNKAKTIGAPGPAVRANSPRASLAHDLDSLRSGYGEARRSNHAEHRNQCRKRCPESRRSCKAALVKTTAIQSAQHGEG